MRLNKKTVGIKTVLFAAIFVVLNLLAYQAYFRLDFTADKRYTLSKTTKENLKNLDDVITITAYFSEDLPAAISSIQQDFQDLLTEYRSASGGQIVYEFINPNESDEEEAKAQQQGIQPVIINVRERDQTNQKRAYVGAVLKKGTEQDVIPVIQPGAAMEYNLTKSIKKLSTVNKPKIGLLQGHGEGSLQQFAQAQQELSSLYDVDTLTLDRENAWADFKTIAILAPKDSFPSSHLVQLDQFLATGGNLLLGLNAVGGEFNQPSWGAITTGVESWVAKYGINVEAAFITDVQSNSITVQRQQGFFTINQQIEFPYFPILTNYEDHPITVGLEAINLIFASPVSFTAPDSSINGGILATSSEKSGKVFPPVSVDINKQWTELDFTYGKQALAAYAHGKMGGDAESKIVVFGDGDFPLNLQGQVLPNNINLLANAIDWLTDDTGLIELRTSGVDNRLIEKQLSDGEKTTFKYLVFLLPILLVLVVRVVRLQARRRRRVQWLEANYEG